MLVNILLSTLNISKGLEMETEDFIKTVIYDRDKAEQFTLEVEERFSLIAESGLDEGAAFQQAVREVTKIWTD